jgi:hypothetical protein
MSCPLGNGSTDVTAPDARLVLPRACCPLSAGFQLGSIVAVKICAGAKKCKQAVSVNVDKNLIINAIYFQMN